MTLFSPKTSRKLNFTSIIATFCLLIGIFSQTGCSKSESNNGGCALPDASSLTEDQQILNYCTTNKINYTKDSRGFYYQIIKQGNANRPNLSSSISITYTGTFLNKNSFDSGSSTFALNDLITGWKYGLPLIGEGGEIILLLPSSLGYGVNGGGCIPPNTPLFFNVKLSTVK
ncbi:MAG: FKBP-type peptidyl-prolyl cis-trans isomerase [Sediminibacterium sp.]|jgi:FKBP-type peptidyl-prolyl cis-trans isomerase FkpA